MNKVISFLLLAALLGCIYSDVHAAELLDVRPVVSGDAVSVEVSADIAMTYTFYTIPGQAQAVVDIAEADPEKVEPLIVVNKGVIASISVDRMQISDIVVSRIIFNLVSPSAITVKASADRKLLKVTFGGSPAAPGAPDPSPERKPVQLSGAAALEGIAPPPVAAIPAENPPEADELFETPLPSPPETAVNTSPATEIPAAVLPAPPVDTLKPVIPVVSSAPPPPPLAVSGIVTGASYIDIRTTRAATDYKVFRLSSPARLVIDLVGAESHLKKTSVAIGRFGIAKVRIGESPGKTRVVIDSRTARFPAHTITGTDTGLRIHFK